MQLRKKHREGAEVFTDSLNDIMFFLLLFFIILSTLANPNVVKMELPSSKSSTTLIQKTIDLQIDANHHYFVNNIPVQFDQLEPVLLQQSQATGNSSIKLDLDKSLTVQDLADVMQIGSDLHLKMVLSTQPTKK